MGFLNTDSMPRLVEKLADGDNIKITGNSKGNRVDIKNITEDVTNTKDVTIIDVSGNGLNPESILQVDIAKSGDEKIDSLVEEYVNMQEKFVEILKKYL